MKQHDLLSFLSVEGCLSNLENNVSIRKNGLYQMNKRFCEVVKDGSNNLNIAACYWSEKK